MPVMRLLLDATQTPFDAIELAQIEDIQTGVADGRVIVVDADATIEVGGMPNATGRGNPSVFFVFTLPDGRVVMAETTMALFVAAGRAFAARYGEPS